MRTIQLAAMVLTACTDGDPVYVPAGATTWNDGYPAATVTAPPGAPAGTLEIASFGLLELTPDDMAPMTALHVRIAATNGSDQPWRLDLPAATVRAGGGEARALLAN